MVKYTVWARRSELWSCEIRKAGVKTEVQALGECQVQSQKRAETYAPKICSLILKMQPFLHQHQGFRTLQESHLWYSELSVKNS